MEAQYRGVTSLWASRIVIGAYVYAIQKTATTIDEQLTPLKQRGMEYTDEQLAKRWLKTVGYCRTMCVLVSLGETSRYRANLKYGISRMHYI